MTDHTIHNPMFEDDEDEMVAAHERTVLNVPRKTTLPVAVPAPVNVRTPKFGEKGYRKGLPNPRRGTPRARVTAGNAIYLAFGAQFPGADAEAYSMLTYTKPSPVSAGGTLPTIRGTELRLEKLRNLGVMESYRRDGSKVVHWGVTDKGVAAAREFGYLQNENAPTRTGIRGISYERLNHFRFIAHVAAQFVSPEGFFAGTNEKYAAGKSVRVTPMRLDDLLSEGEIRRDQKPVADMLAAAKKANKGDGDFGAWRKNTIDQALVEVRNGELSMGDLVQRYPAIRTLGQPQSFDPNQQVISTHWPDLVVDRERFRRGNEGPSLGIEIELHVKSWTGYEQFLRTLVNEWANPAGYYERFIYFTLNDQVETLMRKVDAKYGFNLFGSGRLSVVRLFDRDGDLINLKRRIGE